MAEYGIPALYTVFLWWFSTGVILWLDGLPRGTFRWSMLGATAMLAAGLVGLRASAGDTGAAGAYCAFTCALLAWAWIETSFLTGFLTGPSDAPCPPGATGWRRFRLAAHAILHHELAILAAAAAILAITWDAPNQTGLWTFLALWMLRLSAKLNLFLGVRNLGEALLPPHLRHLASFFARRPMNLLFPVSVTSATAACVLVFQAASGAGEQATGLILLGVLLALGVLEHWFLVLPLPFERLWAWYLRRRAGTPAPVPA
jgi:putative photosynthetic complex assembly protein 2